MSLIKSISGIRGTIGGRAGEGLSPLDIVKFTSAYATFVRRHATRTSNVIVVGRDARLSGRMVLNVVVGTLTGMGFDVVNIGLATTPTTELAVVGEQACGGIIITASHNPKQWNALKLLNENGEFLTDAEGKEVLRLAEAEDFDYADVDHLGREQKNYTYLRRHIDQVLALPLVDVEAIKKAGFKPGKDIYLGMDVAASEFYDAETKTYNMKGEGVTRTAEEQIEYYKELCTKYPIITIEDGLAEDDWAGWKKLT